MQKLTNIKSPGQGPSEPKLELDYVRFRRVHKPVNLLTAVLGIVPGTSSVFLSTMYPGIKLMPVYLLLASAALGGMYIGGIHRLNLFLFPDGVPWPPTSEMISPSNYGRVSRSYFWKFLKWLGISFVLSAIVLVIYRTAT